MSKCAHELDKNSVRKDGIPLKVAQGRIVGKTAKNIHDSKKGLSITKSNSRGNIQKTLNS